MCMSCVHVWIQEPGESRRGYLILWSWHSRRLVVKYPAGVRRTGLGSPSRSLHGLSYWAICLDPLFLFVFQVGPHCAVLAYNLLCRAGWPSTPRDLPTTASWVLRLRQGPSLTWACQEDQAASKWALGVLLALCGHCKCIPLCLALF